MIKTFLKIIWNRKRLRGLLETYPESLKDNISQMVLSLIPFLWMFEIEKKFFLMESLKRQHESKFARKIGKCNVFIFKDSVSQIMLSLIQLLKYIWDRKWYESLMKLYKGFKLTIWAKPYCPWCNLFKKPWKTKKYELKVEICIRSLKGQYISALKG